MLPGLDLETRLQAVERFMREIRGDRGTYESTWSPAWTGLTVVGTPTYAGYYVQIGSLVWWSVDITAGGANTTASVLGTTYINNPPVTIGKFSSTLLVEDITSGAVSLGTGLCHTNNRLYTPTWTARNSTINISGMYQT